MGSDRRRDLNRMIIPRVRTVVQLGFIGLSFWIGYRFYGFFQWAIGAASGPVDRPASVEAFLPISALLGLKRLVLTGKWDEIHPAGLTIFLVILSTALLLRKGFCGWACPVGGLSRLTEGLGRRLGMGWNPPAWLDYPLMAPKYLLMAFFLFIILYKMDLGAVDAFLRSPYNVAVDAKMLLFFIHPSNTTVVALLLLLLLSLAIPNFWCRYLCPYGALLGLVALLSPVHLVRDGDSCIHCSKCSRSCPTGVDVQKKSVVNTPECMGCLECMAVCPVDGCIRLKAGHGLRLQWWILPAGVILAFLAGHLLARATGHWESQVPATLFKILYLQAQTLIHPTF